MTARIPALAAALALIVLAAPALADASEAGPLSLDPEPVPGDTPFTVRFTPPDGRTPTGGVLKVCWSEDRSATFCLLPQRMQATGDGAVVAEAEGIPADQEFGVNLTVTFADGTNLSHPPGEHAPGSEYVFYRTLPAPETRGAPAPGILAALVAAGAALACARRR